MKNESNNLSFAGELVTVITPVFNGAQTLVRCVESLIAQTWCSWELILIDDGSSDETPVICDDFSKNNADIHVIHSRNMGPAAARNLGMDRARGAFLYFLDADDSLNPDALELMFLEYRKSKPDLIIGGLCRVGSYSIEKEAYFPEYAEFNRSQILDYLECYRKKPNRTPMFSSVWGKLYRRDVTEKHRLRFNCALHVFEDADFNFRYLQFVDKMIYLDVYSYVYTYMVTYVSASTKCSDYPEKMFDHLAALQSLAVLFRERYPDKTPEWIVGHACISLTIIQLVRICGQCDNIPRAKLRSLVGHLIRTPMVRRSLPCYNPQKGESKLLRWLIGLKSTLLIISVCRYKARKRYGKCKCL